MREERINEPLGYVLVRFEGGKVRPLRFRWGAREFDVRELNAQWVDRQIRPIRYFFSVTVDSGEVFQLCHCEGDPLWIVDSIMVP